MEGGDPLKYDDREKIPSEIISHNLVSSLLSQHRANGGHQWPYTRGYVAELVIEAKAALGLPQNSKAQPKVVREAALALMREHHNSSDQNRQ